MRAVGEIGENLRGYMILRTVFILIKRKLKK